MRMPIACGCVDGGSLAQQRLIELLMALLGRPTQPNEGLQDLFSRQAPWDAK